jgi:hypothetical protein
VKAEAVELGMNDRVGVNGDRIDGRGTCECNANGVGHVTGVRVNGDAVDGYGGSGVVRAGHGRCAIWVDWLVTGVRIN